MAEKQDGKWTKMLEQLGAIVGLTSEGEIVLLRKIANAEDFIVTCLVAQFLVQRTDKTKKDTLSVDEIIAAGGLTYRPARQTIYNSTSNLAKSRIILKEGKKFRVGERTVLQYFATKVRELLAQAGSQQ